MYTNFEGASETQLDCYTKQKGLWVYLFTWMNGFVNNSENVEQKNIFHILHEETTEYQRSHFQLGDNLFKSLLRAYPMQWICILLLKIGLMGILILNPLIINNLVELLEAPEIDMVQFSKSMAMFLGWILSLYVQMSILNFYQKKIHVQAQAALSTTLFQKLFSAPLPLPPQAEIINLFQIDIPQIILMFDCGVSLFLTPFQVCGAILVYFSTVGMAASIGIVGMLAQVAISLAYGSVYSVLQKKIMTSRDHRVSGIDELLKGILTIKQNCYYKYFFDRIKDKRQNEMKDIAMQQQLYFGVQVIFAIVPVCVMYFTMQIFEIFKLRSVLMVTQNYTQLIMSVNFIPYNLGQVLVARTSAKRYMDFVSQEDVDLELSAMMVNEQITIRDGNYKWSQANQKEIENTFQLRQINLSIKRGSFVVIVGSNGSGKSSLLCSILGELEKIDENSVLHVEGTLSIASQEPFIKQGSIKDNVINDTLLNVDQYVKAITAAQLLEDVIQMPSGHNTDVGENGQSISGGQRKRVHIARALYRESDVYLLDCPFASLDHKTAEKMMHSFEVLNEQERKTLIITCNDLINVTKCDQVIHLSEGKIIYDGDLQNYKKTTLYKYSHKDDVDSIDFSEAQSKEMKQWDNLSPAQIYQLIDLMGVEVIKKEDRQIGHLDLGIFKQLYNLFGRYKTFVFVVVFCIFGMVTEMTYQLKLKSITEVSDSETSSDEEKQEAAEYFLKVYPICQISIALFVFINGIFLTRKGVTASLKLHNNIVNNLLKASVAEFYNVTLGSIIKNRLTNDIFQFDTYTPSQISTLFSVTFNLIATSMACMVLSSYLSYPIIIIYLLFQTHFMLKFIKINLEVSRLQAISKSPVLNYIGETHSGILYNRHCKNQQLQLEGFDKLFNLFSRNSLCQGALYAWLLQAACMMMLILYMCILFVNYFYKINNREAATISVYLSIATSEKFTNFILQFQNFYSNNIYLERCLSLVNNIPKEDSSLQQYSEFENILDRRRDVEYQSNDSMSQIELMTINSLEQVEELQSQNVLEVADLCLKYQNTVVLSNASFKLKKGQKVAIIGRTGAGKTSLMHCLTRLVEPSSGSLKVLGQENRNVSINRIRSLFSVVSQDPFVFEGTIQQNIDPNNNYNSLEINQILNRYGLLQVQLLHNLSFFIEPHGQNLSLGQKQLLVMCRILLQKRKIVILDECTGNLDAEFSKLINLTLDLYMKDKTVIAITHKLDLLDMFDYVMLIERGKIIAEGRKSAILSKYLNA